MTRRLVMGLTGGLVAAAAGTVVLVVPAGGSAASSAVPALPQAPTGTGDTAHLDPALLRAVARAQAEASRAGVELSVTSGWRSHADQRALFEAAVAKYGSERAASRWVLPPGRSRHERGLAVDVGPPAGAAWLERHGVRFGLCRRYDNEPWHFERLAAAKGSACPVREPHA